MKILLRCVCGLGLAAVVLTIRAAQVEGQATEPRLSQSDFTYVGAFKLPAGNFGNPSDTFDYSGGYAAGNVYADPVNGNSLFIKGYLSGLQISNQVSVAQIK